MTPQEKNIIKQEVLKCRENKEALLMFLELYIYRIIENEDYEEAARMRDQILSLKQELNK